FTNAMVAFSTAYAPELKALAEGINGLSEKLLNWSDKNPEVIKTVLKMAGAFVGVKLAAAGVAFGIGLITTAMKANPIGLLVQAIAIAAPLIYGHWGQITEFMKTSWNDALVWIDAKFQMFVDGLLLAANAVRGIFNFSDITVTLPKLSNSFSIGGAENSPGVAVPPLVSESVPKQGWFGGFFDKGNDIESHGMRPPGAKSPVKLPAMPSVNANGFDGFVSDAGQGSAPAAAQSPLDRQRIVQAAAPAQPVKGSIEVNFNNAPQGMRVEPAKSGGNVNVKPNVGYRSFATGMQ
ncbi:MAG: hypothetical protein ACXV7F_13310, partial [Methylomonas sp.]